MHEYDWHLVQTFVGNKMGDIVKFLDARDSSCKVIVRLKAHSKWHPGNYEEEDGGGMVV